MAWPSLSVFVFGDIRRQLPALCVLVAGAVISLATGWQVNEWERREARAAVAGAAADRVDALQGQLIRSMEVLSALKSFYETRRVFTRGEFRTFVRGALLRQAELQGLSWDPRVPAAERESWERRATVEGGAPFRFSEPRPEGGLRPAGERREYFPVVFMETLERNKPALGFDVGSEEKRRAALEQARDTGLPVATAPVRLAQETAMQKGVLVFQPIYSGEVSSPADRREKLEGFAVAAFRVGDLVEPSLSAAVGRGLDVSIFDERDGTEIYRGSAGLASNGMPEWQTSIDVAGRPWRLIFRPTTAFDGAGFHWQAWAAMGAGLVITGLLSGYLWSDGRRLGALKFEVATRKMAEAEAEAANRSKSEFLASMSHEIRTPLNAIMGYSQILTRSEGLNSFQRDAVKTIGSNSGHLLRLIDEILDLSKIDAGRMEVEVAEFDLVGVVNDLVDLFQPPCEEKRLGLRVEGMDGRRSVLLLGDEGKLRQVLINLLGNAVKFTERGCVTLRICENAEDGWGFEVRDTGVGIPSEIQAQIFEPFQQGSAKHRQGGTGLGLTIARRQVELMGGRLELESEAGEGARFYFEIRLPRSGGESGRAGKSRREIERLAPEYEVRALVVDDIRENREVLSAMLGMVGCEIVLAENGRQAVEAVRVSRPDIVFMDMRLPEMDGFEASRRIMEEFGPAGIKIVATSASVLDHERRRHMEAGGDDFVAKPFRAERIYACLQNLLQVEFAYTETAYAGPGGLMIDLAAISLPEDLAARLTMAAELHSATVLKNCLAEVERLGPQGSRLAEHLRTFLASYDMEMIQRIVAQIPIQNEMPVES